MIPQNVYPSQQMPPNMPNQYGMPNQQFYGINPVQSQEFVQPIQSNVQDSLQNFMAQPVLAKKNSMPKDMVAEKKGQVQVHDAGLMAKLNEMNEERPPLKEEDRNLKDTTMSIIEVNKADAAQLNLSSFIGGIENKEKNVHFDAISDVSEVLKEMVITNNR